MATVTPPIQGLSLPAQQTNGGYFATRSAYDVAWSDLVIALLTPIGGRPMNRSFGSSVPDTVFEPMDPTLGSMIRLMAEQCVTKWCPHIRLLNVDIRPGGLHVIQLRVTFTLASDANNRVTKLLSLDRRSVIQFLSS